jgi:hypothetical protein
MYNVFYTHAEFLVFIWEILIYDKYFVYVKKILIQTLTANTYLILAQIKILYL